MYGINNRDCYYYAFGILTDASVFLGFISVAAVSSPNSTLVIDCLYENREFAIQTVKTMMESRKVIKVLCGCCNDVFRLQKDFKCFAKAVVDVQDMFQIWKTMDFENCLRICRSTISKRLQNKDRFKTGGEQQYLRDLQAPGLDFLMEIFDEKITKNKIATVADYRVRPLPDDLVQYTASDSYYTLKVFYKLYSNVCIFNVFNSRDCSQKFVAIFNSRGCSFNWDYLIKSCLYLRRLALLDYLKQLPDVSASLSRQTNFQRIN